MNTLAPAGIRAITFDVDGTLYDARGLRRHLVGHWLRHPRILSAWPAAYESLRGARVGDARRAACERVAARVGGDPEAVRAVVARALDVALPSSMRPETAFPGVAAVLARLDALGVPRAAVSDYPARAKLEAMGLAEGWVAVIDCGALGALKPLPDGLLAAAAAMGVAPAEVLHLGDRPDTDGEMAAAAGARAWIRGRDYIDEAALGRRLFGE